MITDIYLSYSSSSSSSSVICQTTGPKPLPKRFLHTVRSRASSINWQYPLLSLRSSSSFLRLLPRLLVTSICPFIFRSITCRRQFLRKMWPIQLAFRFLISCRIFLWHAYIYIYVCVCVCVCVSFKKSKNQSHAAQYTTHNHNQAHSKPHTTHTQKRDMLPQHQS